MYRNWCHSFFGLLVLGIAHLVSTSATWANSVSAITSTTHVVSDEVREVRLQTNFISVVESVSRCDALVERLTAETDPRVILDLIDLRIQLTIRSGKPTAIFRLADAGIALADATHNVSYAAKIQGSVAIAVMEGGDRKRGLELAAAAILRQESIKKNAEELHPEPTQLFRQYLLYASQLSSVGHYDVLIDVVKKSEQLLPYIDNAEVGTLNHRILEAEIKSELGDHEAALAQLADVEAIAREKNLKNLELTIKNIRASIEFEMGRTDAAHRHYEALLTHYRENKNENRMAPLLSQLASIQYQRGNFLESYDNARSSVEIFKKFDFIGDLAYAWMALASAASQIKGREKEAQFAMSEAERLSTPPRSTRRKLALANTNLDVSAAIGDLAAIRKNIRLQDELREQNLRERLQLQTRIARAAFDVNDRELKLRVLEQKEQVIKLQVERVENRIYWQRITIAVGIVLLIASLFALYRLLRRVRALSRINETDALTGAMSRSAILQFARREIEHARMQKRAVAVCAIDLDDFKTINDTWGHATGDDVLLGAVAAMKLALRTGDALGRVGGDEFLAVLVGANQSVGVTVAERMLASINEISIRQGDQPLKVSLSAGIAAKEPHHNVAWGALIARADEALLKAKRGGKGRAFGAHGVVL
jgi:diguanylate cyclase (GGDEF)-like protein